MIRRKLGLVAIVAAMAIACSSVASAGTITVSGQIQATYSTTGTLLPGAAFQTTGQPQIYRVGIFANAANLAANESFGLAGYDLSMSGQNGGQNGLTRNTVTVAGNGGTNPKPNYFADSPATSLIISSSSQPLSNYYTGGQNGDLGSSTSDLIGLLTAIDPSNLNGLEDGNGDHQPDPRLTIGTGPGGTRIGVVYLLWDGTHNSQLNFNGVLTALANGTTNKFFDSVASTASPVLFTVPEPGTIVLMGIAGLGLAFMARRRNAAA